MGERNRKGRVRALAPFLAVAAATTLLGCDKSGGEFVQRLLIALLVVGIVLFAFHLVILLLNWLRPRKWTAVIGFLLGGFDLLAAVAQLLPRAAGRQAEHASRPLPQLLFGIAIVAVLALLMIGSSWSAWRRSSSAAEA